MQTQMTLTPTKNIKVVKRQKALKLVGANGNAYALMGAASKHNKQYSIYSPADFKLISDECLSGDYHHLLNTLIYFFKVR